MLLAEVYERALLIPHIVPEHYPHDWHLHKDKERYLEWMQKYAEETTVARMGDVAIFKIGRTYSHAGIVVTWPSIVHAWFESCVEKTEVTINPQLARAPVKFFTLKEWK